jgi:hypothetical protein
VQVSVLNPASPEAGTLLQKFRNQTNALRAETTNVPANAPHHFSNTGIGPVRLLCVFSPVGQDQFSAAKRCLPKGDQVTLAESRARPERLALQYRTELLVFCAHVS